MAGNALGVQKGFSWGAVATGAIGAGLGASGTFAAGNTLPSQIGSAIASSLTTQGLNIITGQQKGFSWSSLAVAAVTAPVTSSISQSIKGSAFAQASPLSAGIAGAVAGVATSAVNELTRIAITGGKVNWGSVAIGGIQGGIYGYGEGLGRQANDALIAQQRKEQGNTTPVKGQNRVFTGERINVVGSRGRTDVPAINVNDAVAGSGTADDPYLLSETSVGGQTSKELLSTSPSEGGLSVKNGAADSVKQKTEMVNTANAIKSSSQTPVMNGAMSLLDPNSSFYGLNINQYINTNSPPN